MEWLKQKIASARFDFVRYSLPVGIMSLVLVIISWFALLVYPGPKWGIDFTGGTEVVVRFGAPIEIGEFRAALTSLEIPSDAVTEVAGGAGPEYKVRIQNPKFGAEKLEADVRNRLSEKFGADWVEDMQFNPEVGARFVVSYKGDRVGPSAALEALRGIDGVKVEEGRDDRQLVIKLPGLSSQVKRELSEALGARDFEVLRVDAVGPKVGESLRVQGVMALAATLLLILVYVAFRFDLAYAPGAVLALIHDVSVTVGLFILFGKEFNLTLIGALLTILGYSLNDTIVIYDRIRENQRKYRRRDTATLINTSINETLGRTLATSGTTLVAILAFLFMGGPVIEDFALAITLGIAFGSYSTIYVASPSILVFEDLKPWLSKVFLPLAPKVAPTPEGGGTSEDKS